MARTKGLRELLLPGAQRRARSGGSPEDNPAFQELWAIVDSIPRGFASTYGAVARAAGMPGRARLTGKALREAPKEMNIPWHRVVGAGGKIVFPRNSTHFREQARRLRAEGVTVKEGRVAAEAMTDLE